MYWTRGNKGPGAMKPLSELKAIVDAATQKWKDEGEWFHDHRVGTTIHSFGENDENDAKFISTFNPTTVKALIERIEELEERTIPDDLTSYIQERVKAERERCAKVARRWCEQAFCVVRPVHVEILNPKKGRASDE